MRNARRRTPRIRACQGRPWFVLAAVALSSVAGCSLLTTLDGYSSDTAKGGDGPDAAEAAEAGSETASESDGGDSGQNDGGGDGRTGEGGVADANADTRRWCERQAPAPKVCEDFDDPTGIAPGWAEDVSGSGSSLARTDAGARSAPSALLTRTSGSKGEWAFLRRTYEVPFAKLRTAFDVRVDSARELRRDRLRRPQPLGPSDGGVHLAPAEGLRSLGALNHAEGPLRRQPLG